MRHARLKPSARDTWHHCCNRAVGNRSDRPFDEADEAAQSRFPLAPGLPAAIQLNNRTASAAISLAPLFPFSVPFVPSYFSVPSVSLSSSASGA